MLVLPLFLAVVVRILQQRHHHLIHAVKGYYHSQEGPQEHKERGRIGLLVQPQPSNNSQDYTEGYVPAQSCDPESQQPARHGLPEKLGELYH